MAAKNLCLTPVLLLLLASGCASMAHGTSETIEAASDPAGADVTINCGGQRISSGVTPTRLVIRRKLEGCMARFSREGFVDTTIPMPRGFSRNYWGNLGLTMGFPAGIVLALSDGFLGPATHESEANALASVGLAGAAGLIIDRANGAMYDHPAALTVKLRPQTSAATQQSGPR